MHHEINWKLLSYSLLNAIESEFTQSFSILDEWYLNIHQKRKVARLLISKHMGSYIRDRYRMRYSESLT